MSKRNKNQKNPSRNTTSKAEVISQLISAMVTIRKAADAAWGAGNMMLALEFIEAADVVQSGIETVSLMSQREFAEYLVSENAEIDARDLGVVFDGALTWVA